MNILNKKRIMKKTEFIVQTLDKTITSDKMHELREHLDSDFSHLVGIAISDIRCSPKAILNLVKVKGIEILPEDFELAHIITSANVEPNSRFYTMFEPISTSGDEITVKFTDSTFHSNYNLQIHLLLTNQPENIKRANFS